MDTTRVAVSPAVESESAVIGSTVLPLAGDDGPPAGGHGAGDAFTRQLLAALVSLRDGNFGARLPNDFVGLHGKVADVFNEIAAVTQRRAHETARVSRVVGKEGKLKQRMAVPGAMGGWADEVGAINMLIDDLVWPTTEVNTDS